MRLVLILIATLSISGCSMMEQMQRDYLIRHCNPNNAYAEGMTDGLTPDKMPDTNYAGECDTNKNELNQTYMTGFEKGLVSRPQHVDINKNITVNKSQ